jgi:hypothetical protein
MHLRLASFGPAPHPEFVPESVDLRRQPWRPGELCQIIDLELADDVRARLARAAKTHGSPVAVIVVTAVEAERAVALVSQHTSMTREQTSTLLDAAAGERLHRGIDPPALRRLRAYSLALLAGADAPVQPTPSHLPLRVPYSLAAAWSIAASTEASPLEAWIIDVLGQADLGRTHWEAAAAYAGRSLESWATLTALAVR